MARQHARRSREIAYQLTGSIRSRPSSLVIIRSRTLPQWDSITSTTIPLCVHKRNPTRQCSARWTSGSRRRAISLSGTGRLRGSLLRRWSGATTWPSRPLRKPARRATGERTGPISSARPCSSTFAAACRDSNNSRAASSAPDSILGNWAFPQRWWPNSGRYSSRDLI